jgi:uncharacterized membrane protein
LIKGENEERKHLALFIFGLHGLGVIVLRSGFHFVIILVGVFRGIMDRKKGGSIWGF